MEPLESLAATRSERRQLLKGIGLSATGAAIAATVGAGSLALSSVPAAAQTVSTADVANFALNLEYLEAEFYLRAVVGTGLPADMLTGTGTQGTVTGGRLVPFKQPALAYYAQRIANDELAHVRFLRDVLGSAAVAEPTIDFQTSFNTLGVAAGLISAGQTFDPFADEISFLLAAYTFEDVGVTAYAGAASLLSGDILSYAASILGTEAYHAGAIRGFLADIGAGAATNAISALRQKLSGVQDNGTDFQGNPYNITNVDINGQAFRRTPQQVLSIVYGGGTNSGLFFPNGVNGAVAVA